VPEELRFGGEIGVVGIAKFVLIGAHCVILPGTILPEGMAAAANTVIRKKDYEPWTIYRGYDGVKLCR
jgi:acetyltransferase-like isoleucine patch superfamily enzyme